MALPANKIACLHCRTSKIRCNPSAGRTEEAGGRCQRCAKLGLACEYKEHARGPRPYKRKGDEDQGQAGAASPHSTSKRRIKLAEEPPSFSKATTETDADDRVHYSVDVPSATALSEPPSSTWSLQNLSSPRRRALQTHSSHLFPDAITVGIFSLDEAERHFDFFFEYMNSFYAVFDKTLHTMQYVRTTSSVLLAAILAVASRYRNPAGHHACMRQAKDHIGQMLIAQQQGGSWLPVIQALCTLAFWKDAADESAWRFIGFALRLAFEEGLHKLPRGDASVAQEPQDSASAREEMNRQRTWLYLCCMDQMMSFQRDLPLMISHDLHSDWRSWIFRNPNIVLPEDYWLAAALEYSALRYRVRSIRIDSERSAFHGVIADVDHFRLMTRFDAVKSDLARWQRQWASETCVYPLGFRSKLLLNFYSAFMAFYIARTRLMVESRSMQRSSDVPHRDGSYIGTLLDCYLEAQKLLGAVPEMARTKHVLEYLPETIPVGVCAAAVWCINACEQEALRGQTLAIRESILQAASACRSAAVDKTDLQTQLGKFLRQLLQKGKGHETESTTQSMPESLATDADALLLLGHAGLQAMPFRVGDSEQTGTDTQTFRFQDTAAESAAPIEAFHQADIGGTSLFDFSFDDILAQGSEQSENFDIEDFWARFQFTNER